MLKLALLVLAAGMFVTVQAGGVDINFDEFTSPPVTCCYATTGVTGPLVYPDVTIEDDSTGGYVMNGLGWDNMQTSGYNLFGTQSGYIFLYFNSAASNVNLDVINGIFEVDNFTVTAYDEASNVLFTQTQSLNDYGTAGSVEHFDATVAGIWTLRIAGNADFAIDTINFNGPTGVPEPGGLGLGVSGVVLLGLAQLRRKLKG